jgi:general secretion pathway protein B
MSLILEALRKSEADRRRGETPNVHVEMSPSPKIRRNGIPTWAWWMVAVSLIGATGWWLFHAKTSYSPPQVATFDATTPVAAHEKSKAGPLPPVRHLTPPPLHAIAREPTATTNPASTAPSLPRDLPPPASAPVAIAPPPPAAAAGGNILRLSDLSIEERRGLPPLKLSMHMWNDDPTQRFIILDGNRLHEGDRIGEAIVTTITPDGVMLDWNGRRLKLPIR